MRLSEAGELGLLAELERRGLIVGIEHDAAELAGGLVVTQDALVEGVHFRLDLLSWRELGLRAAAVNLSDLAASAARPEALVVTLAVPPETRARARASSSTRGSPRPACRSRRRHDARRSVVLSVTALGRSERVPGRAGARPGDVLVVTGPLGGAGAGVPRAAASSRPPSARAGRACASGRVATRDARPLGRPRRRRRPHRAPLRLPPRDRPRRRAARRRARRPRLRRGLRAARHRAAKLLKRLGFPVVGRCEAGEGVVLLQRGEPYELPGYEHFKAR